MNVRAAEIVGGTLKLFAETLTDHEITRIPDKNGRTQDSSHPRPATSAPCGRRRECRYWQQPHDLFTHMRREALRFSKVNLAM